MTPPRLEVSGLTAGYGGPAVVRDLDLTVEAGRITCLLGANGAGKSTTLGAITGIVRSTSGTVRLDGVELTTGKAHRVARAGLALVPEDRALFPSLTVAEHLRLAGGRGAGAADAIEWFPALAPLMRERVGVLSGGEQQMVAIARALVGRPRVLLVDEMSLGLAPLVVRSLLDTVAELARSTDCAVLLVEQHVSLAIGVADHAYVLSRGRLTFDGPAADLDADRDLLLAAYLGGGANSVTTIDS